MANARQRRSRKSHARNQQMEGPRKAKFPKNSEAPPRRPVQNWLSVGVTNPKGQQPGRLGF